MSNIAVINIIISLLTFCNSYSLYYSCKQ